MFQMNNNKIIDLLINNEDTLILQEINKRFSVNDNDAINTNLLLTDKSNIAYNIHEKYINSLISFFVKSCYNNSESILEELFLLNDNGHNNFLSKFNVNDLPLLIESLHVCFLNSSFSVKNQELYRLKSKHYLKEYGAVYTMPEITNDIVKRTFENFLTNHQNLNNIKCLDFACGTGRFYFSAVSILEKKYSFSLKDIVCNKLYAVDIDRVALSILRCKIIALFSIIDNEIISAIKLNIINRNILIHGNNHLNEFDDIFDNSIDFKDVLIDGGFNLVFSNPPYYLLKVNIKNDVLFNEFYSKLKDKIKREINYFKKSGLYEFSNQGMLNYYQLSIEMILKMTKKDGEIGIICPSSLFGDLTTSRLRKFLVNNNTLRFIRYYPEASNLFDNVAQSTVIFYLKKGGVTDKIKIEHNKEKFKVALKTINNVFNQNQEIPFIDDMGWNILSKLSNHRKMKDYNFIRNKRGELDLTQYKYCILKDKPTDYRLVRGNMITKDGVVDKNNEFVEIESFINKKSKDFVENDFNQKRLICQQISNIDRRKRLTFTFSEPKDILANSCNYINSLRNFDDLDKLHYLFNSELLNWRFKVTSSNNHINNYELNELPILDLDKLEINQFTDNKKENDILICKLYGLNNKEAEYILGYSIKTTKN